MPQPASHNPVASATSDLFTDTAQQLPDLPASAHGLVLFAFGAGLLLWLAGGKFIKPVLAVMGIVLGGWTGLVAFPLFGVSHILGVPAHLVGIIGGCLLGLVLSVLLFRVAMIVSGAVAFAAAGFLGGAIYLQYAPTQWRSADSAPAEAAPPADSSPTSPPSLVPDSLTGEDLTRARDAAADAAQDVLDQMNEDTRTILKGVAERIRKFAEALERQVTRLWNELSPRDKQILGLSTLIGAALGVLIGVLMPGKSAAMITSMAGAAIWLASATWLAHALEIPGRNLLHRSPMGWAFIWIVFSTLGLMFQWTRTKRKTAKEG